MTMTHYLLEWLSVFLALGICWWPCCAGGAACAGCAEDWDRDLGTDICPGDEACMCCPCTEEIGDFEVVYSAGMGHLRIATAVVDPDVDAQAVLMYAPSWTGAMPATYALWMEVDCRTFYLAERCTLYLAMSGGGGYLWCSVSFGSENDIAIGICRGGIAEASIVKSFPVGTADCGNWHRVRFCVSYDGAMMFASCVDMGPDAQLWALVPDGGAGVAPDLGVHFGLGSQLMVSDGNYLSEEHPQFDNLIVRQVSEHCNWCGRRPFGNPASGGCCPDIGSKDPPFYPMALNVTGCENGSCNECAALNGDFTLYNSYQGLSVGGIPCAWATPYIPLCNGNAFWYFYLAGDDASGWYYAVGCGYVPSWVGGPGSIFFGDVSQAYQSDCLGVWDAFATLGLCQGSPVLTLT